MTVITVLYGEGLIKDVNCHLIVLILYTEHFHTKPIILNGVITSAKGLQVKNVKTMALPKSLPKRLGDQLPKELFQQSPRTL